MDGQLHGKSSPQAYIDALMMGCKCVELDCWDGKDEGQKGPIVYHGYTQTTKISFEDAIKAIKDYCWKVSKFPLILSLENHCNIENQKKMAEIMIRFFGDELLTVEDAKKCMPSPNQLMGKVLIKGKRLPAGNADGEVSEDDEADEEDIKGQMEANNENKNELHKEYDNSNSSDSRKNSFRKDSNKKSKKKKKKKLKLAPELSDLVVYLRSKHMPPTNSELKEDGYLLVSSINEDKCAKLASLDQIGLINHAAK